MSNNHIEDIFKTGFADEQEAYQPGDWDKMNLLLDDAGNTAPAVKPRGSGLRKWGLGLGALLLIGGLAWWATGGGKVQTSSAKNEQNNELADAYTQPQQTGTQPAGGHPLPQSAPESSVNENKQAASNTAGGNTGAAVDKGNGGGYHLEADTVFSGNKPGNDGVMQITTRRVKDGGSFSGRNNGYGKNGTKAGGGKNGRSQNNRKLPPVPLQDDEAAGLDTESGQAFKNRLNDVVEAEKKTSVAQFTVTPPVVESPAQVVIKPDTAAEAKNAAQLLMGAGPVKGEAAQKTTGKKDKKVRERNKKLLGWPQWVSAGYSITPWSANGYQIGPSDYGDYAVNFSDSAGVAPQATKGLQIAVGTEWFGFKSSQWSLNSYIMAQYAPTRHLAKSTEVIFGSSLQQLDTVVDIQKFWALRAGSELVFHSRNNKWQIGGGLNLQYLLMGKGDVGYFRTFNGGKSAHIQSSSGLFNGLRRWNLGVSASVNYALTRRLLFDVRAGFDVLDMTRNDYYRNSRRNQLGYLGLGLKLRLGKNE